MNIETVSTFHDTLERLCTVGAAWLEMDAGEDIPEQRRDNVLLTNALRALVEDLHGLINNEPPVRAAATQQRLAKNHYYAPDGEA